MSIEAMKQALEALEQHGAPLLNHEDAYAASLTSLRQAIEEAEKEEPVTVQLPVLTLGGVALPPSVVEQIFRWGQKCVAHYHPKREWVGLTDKEIMEMLDYGQYGRVPQYARNFVDAIEAKLREKNT